MLIVVTVAILMLSLAGLSFVTMMSTEHRAVHVHGDELQSALLVDSGAELLAVLCELPDEDRRAAGGLLDNPELFRGKLVLADQRNGRHGRFSVVAPNVENDEITGMRFGVENESARLNLAALLRWEQQQSGAGRRALMNLPGMTEAVADAILDWIDADSTPRQSGAEAETYAGLNVPYAPRNAVPASLEELLLVRGVTRELLLGADANFNHQLEPEEAMAASAGLGSFQSGAPLTWAAYLTVCSGQRNQNSRGEARIDLGDDDLARLHQRLSKAFEPEWARFVIWYRQFGPYDGDDPAAEDADGRSDSRSGDGPDFSLPGKFELETPLDLIGIQVALPRATGRPIEVVESPFTDDQSAMREYLPRWLDQVTVTSARVIYGRINVNLAPRAVLSGVPGLDGAMVEQIVAARRSLGARDDPSRRYPTWLLTEGLVDLPQMKSLTPYLTAGGDVLRAQIVGFFDEAGPAARVELVLDATRTPPRQVYWKDLRLFGSGYAPTALGAQPPRGVVPIARGP